MNRISFIALVLVFVSSAALAQETNPPKGAAATQWTISGADIKPPAKKKKGVGASVVIKEEPKLVANVTQTKTNLSIRLSNGKQKFGQPLIHIQAGENTYMRPRLSLTVPLETAEAVTKNTPLKVVAFSHIDDDFEINLVANSGSELPDVVITKK